MYLLYRTILCMLLHKILLFINTWGQQQRAFERGRNKKKKLKDSYKMTHVHVQI